MRRISLPYDAASLTCLVWQPGGQALLMGRADGTVVIWDVAAGAERAVLQAHAGLVSELAFAGDRLFTSGSDGRVLEWDLTQPLPSPTVVMETGWPVLSFARAGDGLVVATDGRRMAASDGRSWARSPEPLERIWWWSTLLVGASEELIRLHEGEPFPILDQGRALAHGRHLDRRAELLGLATGALWNLEQERPLADAGEPVLCWSMVPPDAVELMAAGTADGRILLMLHSDPRGVIRPSASWQAHQGAISSLACSPDGFFVASAGEDGQVLLWTQGETRVRTLPDDTWIDHDVSPTGQLALTTSGSVHVLDGAPITLDEEGWGGFGGAAWLADQVITADSDRSHLRRFALDGTPLALHQVGPWFAGALAVSGSGRVAVSTEEGVRLLDASMQELGTVARGQKIHSLAWSKTGWLAGMDGEGKLTVWASGDRELLTRPCRSISDGKALCWSPDGSWLVASGRPTLLLEVASGEARELPDSHTAAFSADGRWLATVSWSAMVNVWDWEAGRLVAWWATPPAQRGPVRLAWTGARQLAVICEEKLTTWEIAPFSG